MKIAIVSLAGAVGGSEPDCWEEPARALAAALAGQGHEVVAYSRRGGPGPDPPPGSDRVRVARLDVGPPAELTEAEVFPYVGAFADELRAALRRQRPDVVHSHGWLAGLAGLLANREERIPLVHTFASRPWPPQPGPEPGQTVQVEQLRMRRAITRRATRVIVDGVAEQQGLIRLGISRQRISVVPPGVDCKRLNPDGTHERRQAHFRLVLLGPPDATREGAGTAIKALAMLPDTELMIVPDPHDHSWTSPLIRSMHELAARLGVDDRVHLVHAPDPGRRAGLLRSAHVVLALSVPQPPDIALLEAMACAVPVISTVRADPIEAVIDHVTGRHIAPAAPRALALAVRELLNNTAEREGFGIAGRDRAVHRFSWASVAAETTRVYEQLTQQRPAARAAKAV